MCGIVGVLAYEGEVVPGENIILEMTKMLVNRGPDGGNVFSDFSCALGHRRLSIIDIEGGAQPMSFDGGRWWISYNGEIYNYKELRLQLQSEGEVFHSQGDTEVILRGIARHGPRYLEKLNGIFAVALWDRELGKLFLARDHIGIKPLYYADIGTHFIFASEPKAIFASKLIEKKVNKNGLYEYFCRGAAPYTETLFCNVYELEPGKWLSIDTHANKKMEVYYDLEHSWMGVDQSLIPNNDNELLDLLDANLKKSVDRQLVSDVPVGIFLSSGIDSGLLLHYMNSIDSKGLIHAFTYANQDERVDESTGAKNLVKVFGKGVVHHILEVTLDDYLSSLSTVCHIFDEPMVYPSSVPIFHLANLAKETGIKVVLGGQGADELFLGYERYKGWIKSLKDCSNVDILTRNFYFGGGINNVDRVGLITGVNQDVVEASPAWKWIKEFFYLPPLKRMALYDQRFRLHTLLKRDDRMCMGGSVENRVPYLDKELMDWVNAIPEGRKIPDGNLKHLLRKKAEKVFPLTQARIPKIGSATNFEKWLLSNEFINVIREMTAKDSSFSKNHLQYNQVNSLINDHQVTHQYSYLVWALYNIENWFNFEFN
jgi:asparagine synthase (glutamine-hydrolysing)